MTVDLGLNQFAGRSSLARRSFLRGGMSLGVAGLAGMAGASASEPIGARLPDSMKTLGGADLGYGQPSPHEQSVQRLPYRTAPQSAGRSYLQHQRGIITRTA